MSPLSPFLGFLGPLSTKTSSYDAVLHDGDVMTIMKKRRPQIKEKPFQNSHFFSFRQQKDNGNLGFSAKFQQLSCFQFEQLFSSI